jgi:hypothetical protein
MNSFRALCIVSFVLLIVITGCGGGVDVNNVTVTVSPSAATIPVDGQVTLKASEHHDCSQCGPLLSWGITENNGAPCTWVDTPPAGPCPAGTIQATGVGFNGPVVTYFAPSTPGTFHVVVSDVVTLTISTEATSVVTVSP